MMNNMLIIRQLTALSILAIAAASFADDGVPAVAPDSIRVSDKEIETLLTPILEKHKVPGIVAGVVEPQGLTAVGAVGLRKIGSGELVTVNDKVHLGSNTKAMTATRIAMLVEEAKLSWQSTVGEVFADAKTGVHPDFLGVTLEQLLTHRAGLPANVGYRTVKSAELVAEREVVVKKMFSSAPVHPPGTKFLYSNAGYIAAGHMAERVTGASWEELMTEGLFTPLKMSSAGYGFAGTAGQVDQPWGHNTMFGNPLPLQSDNAAVLGPAGTVHCTLADWAKFVVLHLEGARGNGRLLKPEMFKRLHEPPAGGDYAMGWVIVERPWAKGRVLMHSGSNTMWFATVAIAPERGMAFLSAVNCGGKAGQEACDEALTALIQREPREP